MVDHLTGHRTAVGETKAIDYVIQPALQKEQHVVACYAAHVGSHVIVFPELGLGYTIGPAALLLLTAVSSSVTYEDSEFHSLKNPNTIYVNSDSQKSAISAAITDGRTAFAITNGGIFPIATQFSADQLATPVKDGCIFGGWYTDEACTQKFTGTPAANSTYYAQWTEKPIKFVANGGTGSMPNENYTVNQPATDTPSYSISFPECTFTAGVCRVEDNRAG